MIAAIVKLISALKVKWLSYVPCLPYVAIAALALAVLFGLWRIDNLSGALALEQSEHARTKDALTEAVEKGNGWKAAYEEVLGRATAQGEATQACLAREVAAREAQAERTAILQAAQPRPRTEQEKQQVVNDETRIRAADRLNRAW